jgi:putative nucleotidyltransferase with HDIG domain
VSRLYDIDTLLDEVITLPSLPNTVAHIMRLVSDPQCSLSAVARVISGDPPLAIKTLRLVNAAYYGLRQKVSTIEHAVVLLGIKVIKNLAFTATVFDIMKGSVDAFFRHSIAAGLAMRALSEAGCGKTAIQSPEEAFVCGLLHDIGKAFLNEFLPKESAKVAQVCAKANMPWYLAEREIMGVDHAQIGARLAQKWKLPDILMHAVAGHHDLKQCKDPDAKQAAALVATADFICCSCGIIAYAGGAMPVPEEVWTASQLSSEVVPAVVGGFVQALPSMSELMSMQA